MQDVSLRLQMECTMFFQQNPFAFETAEGVAVRLNRPEEGVSAVLERLVELAILEAEPRRGGRVIYRYKPPIVKSDVMVVHD